MGNFFCPDCGYESIEDNERICPHCNQPMEELFVKDEPFDDKGETYPTDVLEKIDDEEVEKAPLASDEEIDA